MARLKKLQKLSFTKDLLQRRVPQIIGIYCAASWGLIQFVDWIVGRFVLSSYLPEFVFILLLSLLPTVFLLAYFHGKPGRDQWTHIEKISVPLNLVFSAVLLFFMFQGKELGAAETTITIRDESGNLIERKIVKAEFTKRLIVYFFKNQTGNPENDWLQQGIPFLVDYDLSQDYFFRALTSYDVVSNIRQAGVTDLVQIPLPLQLKVAREMDMTFILIGAFDQAESGYSVSIKLIESQRGRLLAEHIIEHKDIFSLADQITVILKQDLEIPLKHLENIKDLPVSEIATTSSDALKKFITSLNTQYFENNYTGAFEVASEAVVVDPLFALGNLKVAELAFRANKSEVGQQALEKSMEQIYRIPERMQFSLKSMYYYLNKQLGKRLAILKMWAELYPEDIAAHSNLYQHYRWQSGELDKAVAEVETMLEIDPKRFNYWQTLGDLYLEQGDYSSSIEYYKMYAEKFPTKINALIPVGIVYQLQGDFENARTYYEKASTLEPDNVEVMDRLTDLHSRQGRFDEAYAGYQKALEKANTAQEKHMVYASLEDLFEIQGQIRESIRYMHLGLKAMGQYNDPLNTMVGKIFAAQKYLSIGQADSAFRMTNTINFEPPFDAIKPLAFMNLYIKIGDLEKAREAIEGAKSFIESFGGNWARRHLFRAQAELSEINGDFQDAVKQYNQVLKVRPRDDDVRIKLAGCLRRTKKYDQAQDLLFEVLKRQPIHPKLNLELTRLYLDVGDIQNAKEYLNSALKVWQNADEDYNYFQEALKLKGKIAA